MWGSCEGSGFCDWLKVATPHRAQAPGQHADQCDSVVHARLLRWRTPEIRGLGHSTPRPDPKFPSVLSTTVICLHGLVPFIGLPATACPSLHVDRIPYRR